MLFPSFFEFFPILTVLARKISWFGAVSYRHRQIVKIVKKEGNNKNWQNETPPFDKEYQYWSFPKISSNFIQWFDFTRPLKNWSKSSNKISGKTINFLAMVDNKQNEAKPYWKRPTIRFFPLDAFLRYYRMISVNAKKRRWGLEKAGDVYSHPVMLKARRWCLQLPSMFIISALVSPPPHTQ